LNDNIPASRTRYDGFVQMLPNETFLQITNCTADIAFAGNLQVDLIDVCGNVLLNIPVNENFFYNEFTDLNGIRQIAFEFGRLNQDFYGELVFLRLKHTASNNIWYSAGFVVTENETQETIKVRYKAEGYFRGISYERQNYFQTIRLKAFKSDDDQSTESEELIQLSGNKHNLRPVTSPIDKYKFWECNPFTYKRMIALLSHPIVYIDGFRANTSPSTLTKSEREPDWNLFEVLFESNPTEEYLADSLQIWPEPVEPTAPDFNAEDFNSEDFQTAI
jgi:hypothetical protein